ncbi:PREDICTED: uncharacterized protein LOC109116862 [Tarenaya hassleriana]|uniref:uncharacterized protein LOC109116862 n=1 Tax=Tarenaya hassleriana TaxID=28532 RepID=UPI0008FD2928|nr:PREDICTED: uncharacterized protein LOC109116862 [Tarenaya hassleriana]
MAGWQRNLQLVLRQVGKRVENSYISTAHYSSSRHLGSSVSHGYLQGLSKSHYTSSRPLYQYLQNLGISSSRKLLADEAAVSSPLSSPALLGSGKSEEQKVIAKRSKVQAVLMGIKQSPKKVNLVAALVRGMRVEDALMQLEVTVKRAAKTVYRVIHSARANATHNHGLDPDRLLVAEAFVGKGLFKKRISYHGKGKCGLKIRPECRLTVIVRETTPEEEAEIARLRVHNFKKLSKREKRLVPHKLIETTPIWNRKASKSHRTTTSVPS